VVNTVGSIPTAPTIILYFLLSSYRFEHDNCSIKAIDFLKNYWFYLRFYDEFLKEPDDRPVNMNENYSEHLCGCVMVHYGKTQSLKGEWRASTSDLWQAVPGKSTEDILYFDKECCRVIKEILCYRDGAIKPHKNYAQIKTIVLEYETKKS
jgi:hypothetical protein